MHFYANSRFRRAVLSRIGHRGLFLMTLGLFDVFFGMFLITGGRFQFSLELSAIAWGWIWAGVGVFLVIGAFAAKDAVFFAVAVFLKVAWALEYVRLTFVFDVRDWTRAAYWTMFAILVLVASAWPESRPVVPAEDAATRAQTVQDEADT